MLFPSRLYSALSSPGALRRTSPHPNYSVHRTFHQSPVLTFRSPGDPVIFKNNLQKTLQAHRLSNRSRLVRKVLTDVPSEKRIDRPIVPSESRTDHAITPTTPSASLRTGQFPRSVTKTGKKRSPQKASSISSNSPTASTVTTHSRPRLQWDVDVKRRRPEERPWLSRLNLDQNPRAALSYLDTEIRALERYLTPTQREQENVNQLAREVAGLLRGIAPNPPQVVGSRRTGMAVSHSDVNFILPIDEPETAVSDPFRSPSPTRPKMIGFFAELLSRVEHVLQQDPMFTGQVHMSETRFPVLSATHRHTGLQLRFCCTPGLDIPPSVERIQDYHTEYPPLRPLYLTLQLILESRGLFGAHMSSVGADALLMMIVAFLKMNHGRFQQRADGLGEQLLALLQMYGVQTPLQHTGISVEPPSFFNADTLRAAVETHGDPASLPAHLRGQRSLINLKRTALARRNFPVARRLCIQDPSHYMHDLGRSCTRTPELQAAFSDAYSHLRTSIDRWDESPAARPLQSILSRALRANFRDFERVRDKVSHPLKEPVSTQPRKKLHST